MRRYQLALIQSIGEQTDQWFLKESPPISTEALHRFLHKIRGTAGVVGLEGVCDTAGSLMHASSDRTDEWPADELKAFLQPLIAAVEEAAREPDQAGSAAEPMTIVLFEDDPAFLAQLSGYLERRDFRIIAAAGIDAALGALRQAKPDCLIAGGRSLESGAFELLRQLRAREAALDEPGVPAVVAASEEEDSRPARIRAFRLGADDYVVKPIDLAELTARLYRYVSRKRELERLLRKAAAGTAESKPRDEEA